MASKAKWYHVEIKRKSAKIPTRVFPLGWKQGDPYLEFENSANLTDTKMAIYAHPLEKVKVSFWHGTKDQTFTTFLSK